VLCRAANASELWEQLCSGIPDVYRMEDHITALRTMYDTLLQSRKAGTSAARVSEEAVSRA
jgi:hypothetical protein